MFGWEGGGLQRRRAGSGWMVGIGVTRMLKSMIGAVIVCSKVWVECGILLIVPVLGLLSVPTLQTGDQRIT